MKSPSVREFRNALVILGSALLYACGGTENTDRCCVTIDLPPGARETGQGGVQVNGSTGAYFYVMDESGNQVTYEVLNKTVLVKPGQYRLKVNNSSYPVTVAAGKLSSCVTGTLMVSGNTSDYYYVMDSVGGDWAYEKLGKPLSFFPFPVRVKVNNTETPAVLSPERVTEIQTGTLVVKGNTGEYYYVLDELNKQLNYNTLEKPLSFLPGAYHVKVNNTSMKASVAPGQVMALATGTVLVKGLTDEYYYVFDSLGNSLNYQRLNKPLAFFPGSLVIKVNNTQSPARVVGEQVSEYATGSIILTGGGNDYYYVFDNSGNQLNYNSLNKSLSFFPSEYEVRIGQRSRKATVTQGELTSLAAFQ